MEMHNGTMEHRFFLHTRVSSLRVFRGYLVRVCHWTARLGTMDMDGGRRRPADGSEHGGVSERPLLGYDGHADRPRPPQKTLLQKLEPHDIFSLAWIGCITILAWKNGMTSDLTAMMWGLVGLIIGRRTRNKNGGD